MIQFGDVATWAAAVVALLAAGIAIRQTREARRSSSAAEKQAAEAARSSSAAEKQAQAAEEQLALMRAERDSRDAPAFTVSTIDAFPDDGGLSTVILNNGVFRGPDADAGPVDGADLIFNDVRQGRTLTFYASADRGYVGSSVAIGLTCRERGGERTWQLHYAWPIDPRPEHRPALAQSLTAVGLTSSAR